MALFSLVSAKVMYKIILVALFFTCVCMAYVNAKEICSKDHWCPDGYYCCTSIYPRSCCRSPGNRTIWDAPIWVVAGCWAERLRWWSGTRRGGGHRTTDHEEGPPAAACSLPLHFQDQSPFCGTSAH